MNQAQQKRAEKLFDDTLKQLSKLIANGTQQLNQKTGEIVTLPPSPTMLRAAMAFLNEHKIGRAVIDGNPVAERMQKLRKTGKLRLAGTGKLPPVNTEQEDAATA